MELNFTVETKDVLLDMIKRHNKMYRMGTPEISDAEYDAEIELLKTLDPDNECCLLYTSPSPRDCS